MAGSAGPAAWLATPDAAELEALLALDGSAPRHELLALLGAATAARASPPSWPTRGDAGAVRGCGAPAARPRS